MSTHATQPHAPGWYPDPAGEGLRWWDGEQWTGRRSLSPPVADLPLLGPRFARLADVLGRLLLANAALSLLTAAVERVSHHAAVSRTLAVLALTLFAVDVLAWGGWQWRMVVSSPDQLRLRPALHLGSWLIPVANLWLPAQSVGELWHAYEPHDARGRGRGMALVLPWWIAWVVSTALGAVGLRTLLEGQTPGLTLTAAWVMAALLARAVVRRLSWRALQYHHSLT